MTTRRQDTKNHRCELPNNPDDIVPSFIETGIFVNSRRKLKRLTMVSSKHPLCRFYIHSLITLRTEERRHLVRHYKMIHPFSMFNFYWKMYISFVIFGTNFIWPSIAPYFNAKEMNEMMAFYNGSFLVLIVLSFFTGYYDKTENNVILNSRQVAMHYISTYFFFDVFAIGGVVARLIQLNEKTSYFTTWSLSTYLTWFFPLCKFARYPYFLSAFREMKIYFGINHFLYQALVTFLSFMFFLLFMITIIYIIISQFPEFNYRSHLDCVQSSLKMILMVSHGYHESDRMVDKIFPIVFITFGFVVHLMILIFIMQLWFQFYSMENQQITVYNSIQAFMSYKALPLDMRERIFLYLDFKYQRHFYKDSSIIRATSPSLRKEILVKISMESTQGVDIFESVPERILEKLRSHLISKIFLPGDIIIKAGSRGRSMYCIKRGTVRITKDEIEICRLRDGAHFGEIALLTKVPRVADITAVTPCELYVLNRLQFLEVFSQYPEMLKNLTTMATERIAGIKTISQQDINKTMRSEVDDSKELDVLDDDVDVDSETEIY